MSNVVHSIAESVIALLYSPIAIGDERHFNTEHHCFGKTCSPLSLVVYDFLQLVWLWLTGRFQYHMLSSRESNYAAKRTAVGCAAAAGGGGLSLVGHGKLKPRMSIDGGLCNNRAVSLLI